MKRIKWKYSEAMRDRKKEKLQYQLRSSRLYDSLNKY